VRIPPLWRGPSGAVYSRGKPRQSMRVSTSNRYRDRVSQMHPFRTPWRGVLVQLGFRVSPASAINAPALAVRLLSLVGTVSAVLSRLSTLRMGSCRPFLFLNRVLPVAVKVDHPFLAQRRKDRRLQNLLAPRLAPMPLKLASIQ
jgi:hypothetical protein